jgi:hypothetical protein
MAPLRPPSPESWLGIALIAAMTGERPQGSPRCLGEILDEILGARIWLMRSVTTIAAAETAIPANTSTK